MSLFTYFDISREGYAEFPDFMGVHLNVADTAALLVDRPQAASHNTSITCLEISCKVLY
jgi:hypothetical protein